MAVWGSHVKSWDTASLLITSPVATVILSLLLRWGEHPAVLKVKFRSAQRGEPETGLRETSALKSPEF